ncbi:MAG: PmoA family protein [Puniceicoccales bacterium]|jgi:hypothetical protein|nr:PmoA family protein [Puniceicoccales bacterium]
MERRNFLKNSVFLAGLGLLPPLAGHAATAAANASKGKPKFPKKFVSEDGTPPQAHLTSYSYENQIWFRKNNAILTAYRANPTQKYPYLYPFTGPRSGRSVVTETGSPWPHHRGIFFGCDRVNGGNYWQNSLKDGQILSQGFRLEEISETAAIFTDSALWAKPGQKPILEDRRRYKLQLIDADRHILDAYFELTPLVDVTIQQTNHGLFGVRCAPDISVAQGEGTLESSTGLKITKADGRDAVLKKVHGQQARWLAFHGKRSGLDVAEGVAVLVPDGLPGVFGNQKWFARDYGNISPMPMLFLPKGESIKLPKGEVVKLRYRVVAFAGTPQSAKIPTLWEEFNTIA